MYTQDNDYGCTRHAGVSDMTETNGTLIDQLEKAGAEYKKVSLPFAALPAEPAYLLHYISKKSGSPLDMIVLVIPLIGPDSWAQEYYYFPGMSLPDADELNWIEVYEHVKATSWETTMKKISHPTACPSCGKMSINQSDTYEDIRGRVRCAYCHVVKG